MKRVFPSKLVLVLAGLLILIGTWGSVAQEPPPKAENPAVPAAPSVPGVAPPAQVPVPESISGAQNPPVPAAVAEPSVAPPMTSSSTQNEAPRAETRPGYPGLGAPSATPPATSFAPGAPGTGAPIPAPPSSASRQYQMMEAQVRATAQSLRGQSSLINGIATFKQASATERAALKEEVRKAFDARQELLRQEIDRFRKRLEHLSKILDARDRGKETIIDRRVDELLSPELNWEVDHTQSRIPVASQQMLPGTGYPGGGRPGDGVPRTDSSIDVPGTPGPNSPFGGPPGLPGTGPGEKPADPTSQLPPAQSSSNAGLKFLQEYSQLKELSLDMTQDDFIKFAKRQKIDLPKGHRNNPQQDYVIPTEDGAAVIVTIREGKVSGVQRMRGDKVVDQFTTSPPTGRGQQFGSGTSQNRKAIFKIFNPKNIPASDLLKTLDELAGQGSLSMSSSVSTPTNSLIIFAQPEDMETIETLIKELDVEGAKSPDGYVPSDAFRS